MYRYYTLILLFITSVCYADSPVVYQTIALEAGGEPLAGQIAVACVIRQRADERGQTFEQVVLSPYQFSCHNGAHRELTAREIVQAKRAWAQSAAEYKEFDANLYCRYNVYPNWRANERVEFRRRIRNHIFFKESI